MDHKGASPHSQRSTTGLCFSTTVRHRTKGVRDKPFVQKDIQTVFQQCNSTLQALEPVYSLLCY